MCCTCRVRWCEDLQNILPSLPPSLGWGKEGRKEGGREGGREGEPGSNSYHLQARVKFYALHVSSEVV